jgi:hypothetical protein
MRHLLLTVPNQFHLQLLADNSPTLALSQAVQCCTDWRLVPESDALFPGPPTPSVYERPAHRYTTSPTYNRSHTSAAAQELAMWARKQVAEYAARPQSIPEQEADFTEADVQQGLRRLANNLAHGSQLRC